MQGQSTGAVLRMKRLLTQVATPGFRVVNRIVLARRYRPARFGVPTLLPAFRGPLLLVFPHVDDETIAAGGAMLRWQAEGVPVDLVYTTDSSAGGVGPTPSARAATRRAEANTLAQRLGLRSVRVLSGVNERLAADAARVTTELARVVAEGRYEAAFVVGPVDAHHEHRTSAAIIADALVAAGFGGDVYVGENSTPLPPALVTHALPLDRGRLRARDTLFRVFRSQPAMGFDVFHDLARGKRGLVPAAHAVELFHRTDADGLARLVAAVDRLAPHDLPRHRIGTSWGLLRVLREARPDAPIASTTSSRGG